jgi:isoamylase
MPQELASAPDSFDLLVGMPAPLGATAYGRHINFAVYAADVSRVILGLFASGLDEPTSEIVLDSVHHKTGEIWHVALVVKPDTAYAYCVEQDDGERCTRSAWLIDPYATALIGRENFGPRHGQSLDTRRCLPAQLEDFDWQGVLRPQTPWNDTVIYELHVRGFTRAQPSAAAGTFAGLIKKIPYLQHLGITTVELLPIFEFEEDTKKRKHPDTDASLVNYWGYDPISFFAPKAGFAAAKQPRGAGREFKQLVRELHRAGIEVILDVVYNHTGEGESDDPSFAYRVFAADTYYQHDGAGEYRNYSGCGNTLNCNHPVVADLIVASLRHWVSEYRVDGFRFDLASILTRDQNGTPLANPPLVERIASDPVLSSTKLIAEAWDAAGLHQVGHFPAGARFAEWNDSFRDTLRRFVRGEQGLVGMLAQAMAGSGSLYQASGRSPYHSINFVTCHDGFTLSDLVSYSGKYNLENGEHNRDGANEDLSWNCGVEGPTEDPEILKLRGQQTRNFLTLLMLAAGTPMLLAGDEFARTQRGNNNAWCQDSDISWIDWDGAKSNADLTRFVATLTTLRRELAPLRPTSYAGCADAPRIVWHGVQLGAPDWAPQSRSLAMETISSDGAMRGYLVANAFWQALEFQLPRSDSQWLSVVDTHCNSPNDVVNLADAKLCADQDVLAVAPRSVRLLVTAVPHSTSCGTPDAPVKRATQAEQVARWS